MVNDKPKDAQALVSLLRGKLVHINLIQYNPIDGMDYQPSSKQTMLNFQKHLQVAGFPVTMRYTMGQDIDAGCGQLARKQHNPNQVVLDTDIAKRASILRREISRYRDQMHGKGDLEISEGALDSLKHELSQLESKYPYLVTPNSPTQRVAGKPLDKFEKVTHRFRMFSLHDGFDLD